LARPTQASGKLFDTAAPLLRSVLRESSTGSGNAAIRLLGVRLSGFAEGEQMSLFGAEKASTGLDKAMDAVRNRFGEGAVSRGRLAPGSRRISGPRS
jgi:hypothetical protein